ncbi:ABC transporter permease [Pelagivirga sediminicola]|uniref:ABC transporter permease n=1 Tax=Pelagivirga sediminicola TaxID=2170575 RepID=A0A2T7G879_9RHOB|nr:ABC transporter permease [Pelagivirga sediminicola]PVA10632.1 ABC transporter permease [Pelagivirga sediminicola]
MTTATANPAADRSRMKGAALALPALLLLLGFFVAPVLSLLVQSVTEPSFGLQNYRELIATPTYATVFFNTFLVATLVTFFALVLGFPVAWALAVLPPRWAGVIFAVVLLSMWTNLLARTYAWMVLLQTTGVVNKSLMALGIIDTPLALINNLTGVTIGMVYIMLPFIILPMQATLRTIDPATLQAAALCGASRWQAFWRVLLPLALPGIASGGLIVFVMSLGYFVTPALLGGTSNMMLAELIAQLVQSLLRWGMGGAAAFVLLVITLALYAVQVRYLGAGRTAVGG